MTDIIKQAKIFLVQYTPTDGNRICECCGNKICLAHVATELVKNFIELTNELTATEMREECAKLISRTVSNQAASAIRSLPTKSKIER